MHAAFDRWWNGISLRAKITGVTVLLLTFGLAVAGIGTANVLRQYLTDQVDQKVKSGVSQLRGFDAETVLNCAVQTTDHGFVFAVLDADGNTVCEVPSGATALPRTSQITTDWVTRHNGSITTVTDASAEERWRLTARFWTQGTGFPVYTVVIGVDLQDVDAIVGKYALIFTGFAIAVIVLGAALTQLLVTSTFAPLRDVERTAARFAAGDYTQRLGGATPNTEVGRLNRSLNAMLARIDQAMGDRARTIEQMRRFVGDASHELRTPLVSLRGYAELYRMGAIQKPEDVAQAMDRIEREAIRMGELVEDLLQLARLDEQRPLQLTAVDLLPIARDAALDISAAHPDRAVTVIVPENSSLSPDGGSELASSPQAEPAASEAASTVKTGPVRTGRLSWLSRGRRRGGVATAELPVTAPAAPLPPIGPVVLAEENKIRQVVTNLCGNALRYTPAGSPLELVVDVDQSAGFGQISVVDHGEGIPPQLREKIFQRFFRADTSRTRETGGSGLGLAIVAGIVQNHRGLVEVLETPGGGATFRVSLPLVPRSKTTELSTIADLAAIGDAPAT